ncbi:Initiation-specific alpha-1,6-mannosyltransferase [Erysiphe necator]|uniref:Putative cell surface n=1 Tax=Uncinula necator TaxID=52586 RepID=A0A0B1NY99_UNCNE|nr:Initiation-specific alpha-1,6-mannosyltransferase [Erysiphe necator]KHJ30015.1 putative cell surface [Erysiphe necator]
MLVTVAQYSGSLVKCIRRSLPVRRFPPIYLACILLLLVITTLHSFGPSLRVGEVIRREWQYNPFAVTGTKFPKKIWQSWKVDVLQLEEKELHRARSWTSKNPGYRYEMLTDGNDMDYVEHHFGPAGLNRQDIVHTYRTLNAKIIKADLLRYLIMYVEGGLYADIDVEALRPIERFIPERWNEKDIDMIVGVEIDMPHYSDHPILGPKSKSFCQWTFMCKPRLPVMMQLIDNIIVWLNQLSRKQKLPISELVLDFDEVITGTGPSAFTNAILADMRKRTGRNIQWETFHDMIETKLVGGVLVLTVEAFAAGQGHSDSGTHEAKTALVKHHYHASGWPKAHPRHNHPAYGEVEACNWKRECVDKWDADTAAFSTLPEAEQKRLIAKKEEEDKKRTQEEEAREKERIDNERQEREHNELEEAKRRVSDWQAAEERRIAEEKKAKEEAERQAALEKERAEQSREPKR